MKPLYALFFLLILSCAAFATIDPQIDKTFDTREVVKVVVRQRTASIGGVTLEETSSGGTFISAIDRDEFERMKNDSSIENITMVPVVVPFLAQSIPLVNGTNVWNLSIGGTKINGTGETICVVDTGVNASHPAFNGNVIAGYSYCADENCVAQGTNYNDSDGHGTHVAGIIASQNDTYRGVAPGAKIISIRVFNSTAGAFCFIPEPGAE